MNSSHSKFRSAAATVATFAHRDDGTIVRRLALRLVEHSRLLTDEIDELTAEITVRVTPVAPSLLERNSIGDVRPDHPQRRTVVDVKRAVLPKTVPPPPSALVDTTPGDRRN